MTATVPGSVPTNVLLADDSAGDVRLTREALRYANASVVLYVATDGVEAMDFLYQRGAHAEAPRPELILLDLNMPKMSGNEVLARIKSDESLKTIPTLILTTSQSDADIRESYRLHANAYLNKPVQLEAFESLIVSINEFWLNRARLRQLGRAAGTEA